MRSTRIWTLLVAVAAALAVPAGRAEATSQVEVGPDRFSPAEVRVEVEETVRWVMQENEHTITSDDGLFDSGRAGPGSIFVARFHNAGRFAYYCTVHGGPGGQGMSGVVVVGEPRPGASAKKTTTSTTAASAPSTTSTTAHTTPPPSPPAPTPSAAPAPAHAASTPPPRDTVRALSPVHVGTTTTSAAPTATPPDTSTTSPPPAAPEPPAAAALPSGPDPGAESIGDGPDTGDLYGIDRKALQRRLTASTGDPADGGGSNALAVAGGALLALGGLVLVVPGWRSRRR